MVDFFHDPQHVADIEVDRARNRRVKVPILGLRIDGRHLACLDFTDEIRNMGVEKGQALVAWQDFVVWYFAGKQRNAAQEDKRRETPSGGSHAGLIPVHYVLHRCGIALPKIRNGGIHQMPFHLVLWQIQQPVTARLRERRALVQPCLAPCWLTMACSGWSAETHGCQTPLAGQASPQTQLNHGSGRATSRSKPCTARGCTAPWLCRSVRHCSHVTGPYRLLPAASSTLKWRNASPLRNNRAGSFNPCPAAGCQYAENGAVGASLCKPAGRNA